MRKDKTIAAIALFLILTFAISLAATPAANAHDPPWTIISFAYLVAAPNPVGVGQTTAIVMWIDTPLVGAAVTNDIRRHDYTLTITDSDDVVVETKHWDIVDDTTSIQYYQFTPTTAGNYTLKFEYEEQTYIWNQANTPGLSSSNADYENDTFTAASRTATLVVQEEPLPAATNSYPLPAEYWTRPIEGQNTDWWKISSNWLGRPYVFGAGAAFGLPGNMQPDGTAPNSAHVMWTKPIQYGGVVGGSGVGVPGNTFYTGGSYNVRFSNPLVMYGTLYYQEPYGNSGGGGDYVAVDLRTGEELWRITNPAYMPSFGYLYDYESPNQHGILPNGALIAEYSIGGIVTPFGTFGGTPAWTAYDPRTGELTSMNITNIPSGLGVAGPHGEYLKYILTNYGNSTNPDWYLMQWNSSNVFGYYGGFGPANWYSGTVDASVKSAYDWNVSLNLGPGSWSVGADFYSIFPLASLDNIMLLTQGGFGGHPGDYLGVVSTEGANITAVNLNTTKGTRGNILWTEHYDPAPNNNTRGLMCWDTDAGYFVFWDKEDMLLRGVSLADGKEKWVTDALDPANDWMFLPNQVQTAYGKVYWSGYGGTTYTYDITNGDLLWTYGNGGPGNSTDSGLETPWGRYPAFIDVIADDKVYLCTTEHSPNTPLYKDSKFRAINATDGTELWTLMGYATQMYGGTDLVADGFFVFLNCYDMQIYSVGRGPSETTVTASPKVSVHGDSVLVEGTVIDIASGTQQDEQAARFPNGVPAVSDDGMSAWMEYVYMQKPRPKDAMGVDVILSVLDPNNNYYEIGNATTDASGTFSFMWEPLVPGKYTVIATFAGTESYWPSQAETAVGVTEAPEATPPPTPPPATMTDTYVTGFGIAIIVAIAIVGVLLLRKH